MATLASVDIVLGLDTKRLERDLSKAERSLVRLRRSGQQMKRLGRTLTVGVTLPLTAAAGAAVKLATDAEESANKFDVVMGPAADRVRKKLERLTETVPETSIELQRMAAGLQDMLVPMGVARGRAADMSSRFVKLAGDIASFNNVPIARALEAMKSGLAGMSRPLRRFGVDVRKAALKTIALRDGLIESGEEMDTTARAQAVMTAVIEDSRDAMGDAARTADEAANTFRFLKRDVKELGEQFGRILLPRIRELAAKMSDFLNSLENTSEANKELILGLAGAAAAAGPVLSVTGNLAETLAGLALATGSAAKGLAALVGGGVLAGIGLLAARIAKIATSAEGAVKPLSEMREQVDGLVEHVKDLTKAQAEQQLLAAAGQVQMLTSEINRLDREIEKAEQSTRRNGQMLDTMSKSAREANERVARLKRQKRQLMKQARDLQARMESLSIVLRRGLTEPARDADRALGGLTDTIRTLARAITRLLGPAFRTLGPLDTPGFGGFTREARRTARQAGGPFTGRVTGRERVRAFTDGAGVVASAARSAARQQENLGSETVSTAEVIQGTLVPAISAVANISRSAASALLQMVGSILQALSRLPGIGAGFGAAGGILGAFAGFFQHGGHIGRGQFGIVGERGPEFVQGPATVSPGGLTISVDASSLPQPMTPFGAARDAMWQELLDESVRVSRQSGGELS